MLALTEEGLVLLLLREKRKPSKGPGSQESGGSGGFLSIGSALRLLDCLLTDECGPP
jgi:hypothetical protein